LDNDKTTGSFFSRLGLRILMGFHSRANKSTSRISFSTNSESFFL
jgi:hypothetical protein